jgi:hypothetical protein
MTTFSNLHVFQSHPKVGLSMFFSYSCIPPPTLVWIIGSSTAYKGVRNQFKKVDGIYSTYHMMDMLTVTRNKGQPLKKL